MHISGTSFLKDRNSDDYYFSKYLIVWDGQLGDLHGVIDKKIQSQRSIDNKI